MTFITKLSNFLIPTHYLTEPPPPGIDYVPAPTGIFRIFWRYTWPMLIVLILAIPVALGAIKMQVPGWLIWGLGVAGALGIQLLVLKTMVLNRKYRSGYLGFIADDGTIAESVTWKQAGLVFWSLIWRGMLIGSCVDLTLYLIDLATGFHLSQAGNSISGILPYLAWMTVVGQKYGEYRLALVKK